MANSKHVSKLREGVDAWNRWREENWNVKPDLSGLDLCNDKSFRDTNLWDGDSKRINLCFANLGWADLDGVNLRGSHLDEVNLVEANLAKVNLQGASLANAKLDSAILSQGNLKGTNLTGARLDGANLRGADLSEANLINASLESASLAEAKMNATHLSGANLRFADCNGADLRSAQLSAANLANADLSNADLWLANLSDSYLVDANLENTNLIRSDLHKSNLTRAILYGADLRDANMLGTNVEQAGIIGIKYERRFMRGKYQGIRGVETTYGDAIWRRDAMDQDYIDTLASRWARSPMIVVLWLWSLIDYGRSLFRTVWTATLMIIAFGFVYMANPTAIAYTGELQNWFTPYYASLLTFTTLGFSEPVEARNVWGQLLLSIEVVLGYFTLGLLLAILLQKIARRS